MTHAETQPARHETTRRGAHSGRDVLVVIAITLSAFVFAGAVELNEWLIALTEPLEPYQLDELPFTFLVLVLSMSWFSWRRWVAFSNENMLRMSAQQALTELLAENRLLIEKNVVALEEERRFLARELHDELGQSLNAIKLDAVAIRHKLPKAAGEIHDRATSIIDVADHVHESIRNLTQRLRPVALDELGLQDALAILVGQWERRNAPTECTFQTSGTLDDLGEMINITLYRCVQECLTNITRHAHATAVKITLDREYEAVRLALEDNGQGMDPNAKRDGLGLAGLRERVQSLRGTMNITRPAAGGTRIALTIPLGRILGKT